MDDGGPKWRLEHASNGLAVCNRAACKRAKDKIVKGELRIGTHTLFDDGGQSRWYMAWRHWGCATKHQIAGLVETTGKDPAKAPGYDRLSPESQEQVNLAFEHGGPVDKDFKGICTDLAKDARRYGKEYRDVSSYKVDVVKRQAACRGGECLEKNIKITKGHLRLGLSVPFDGEHESMVYKHWKCMSAFDLEQIIQRYTEEPIQGIEDISEEFKQAVLETFETGKVVAPPEPTTETPAKTKKSRTKKKKVTDDEEEEDEVAYTYGDSPEVKAETPIENQMTVNEEEEEEVPNDDVQPSETKAQAPAKARKTRTKKEVADEDGNDADAPKPKPKKSRAKKRSMDEMDEPEYVPKKSRSRSTPMKEVVSL